jgi:hypothetical protein
MRLLIPDTTFTNRDNAVPKPARHPHALNETRFWYPKITRAGHHRSPYRP